MLKQKIFDVCQPVLNFVVICTVLVLGTGLLGPLHFAFFKTWAFLYHSHNLVYPMIGAYPWSQFLVVVTFAIHAWLFAWIIRGIMAAARPVQKAAMDAYHLFLKVRATLQRWYAAWRKWCGEDEAVCVEEIEIPTGEISTNEVPNSEARIGEEQ